MPKPSGMKDEEAIETNEEAFETNKKVKCEMVVFEKREVILHSQQSFISRLRGPDQAKIGAAISIPEQRVIDEAKKAKEGSKQ